MPTFEALAGFNREFRRLSPTTRNAFLAMLPLFIAALREMRIRLLPPDVNHSGVKFTRRTGARHRVRDSGPRQRAPRDLAAHRHPRDPRRALASASRATSPTGRQRLSTFVCRKAEVSPGNDHTPPTDEKKYSGRGHWSRLPLCAKQE